MTVRAASVALGVHENTIRNWIASGRLEAVELPSGVKRPTIAAVLRVASEQSASSTDTAIAVLGRLADDLETQARQLRDTADSLTRRRNTRALPPE